MKGGGGQQRRRMSLTPPARQSPWRWLKTISLSMLLHFSRSAEILLTEEKKSSVFIVKEWKVALCPLGDNKVYATTPLHTQKRCWTGWSVVVCDMPWKVMQHRWGQLWRHCVRLFVQLQQLPAAVIASMARYRGKKSTIKHTAATTWSKYLTMNHMRHLQPAFKLILILGWELLGNNKQKREPIWTTKLRLKAISPCA